MAKPLVSVCCIVYNQEQYIRECLESLLMQKTAFPIEILIHDDASTDHTADIIREYEAKYPDVIKPICQTENQFSKGDDVNATYNFSRAQGKFIALCEGDDFWTDPDKLQLQVDFMEAHADYSMVACGGYILNDFKKVLFPMIFPAEEFTTDCEAAMKKILLNDHPFHTAGILFSLEKYMSRKDDIRRDSLRAPMQDLQQFFYLASMGKVKYLKRRMFVYRIHGKSVSHYANNRISSAFVERCLETKIKMARHNHLESLIPLLEAETKPVNRSRMVVFLKALLAYARGFKAAYKKYTRLPIEERIRIDKNYHFRKLMFR